MVPHSSFINHPSSFRAVTLGCKVNQYETEHVREWLLRLGYREAGEGEPADLCIVNTCTVTAEGDLKSRKVIRQLARRNPNAQIVVMGCYATRAPEVVAALPGVVEVVTDKQRLPELLARLTPVEESPGDCPDFREAKMGLSPSRQRDLRGGPDFRGAKTGLSPSQKRESFPGGSSRLVDLPSGISCFGRRHRAYVKVQDGCRMPCSYCIIPLVRPVVASRPVDDVLDEVRRLIAHGHREIVLTGIHLGHYGVDFSDGGPDGWHWHDASATPVDLAQLVGRLVSLEGQFRLRISSIEAVEVTPELVALMADRPDRICPHLHISMQSGSDRVLRRMRRRWASGRLVQRCRAIRESLDHPALTTDVIVGFPGESEADFEATCRAVEEVGFSKLHVFRFSPRQGTPAADMPDQVPQKVKKRRAAHLAEIGQRLRRRFSEGLAGRQLQVLVEREVEGRPGMLAGTSARYVPVELPGGEALLGQLVHVTAGPVCNGRIHAAGCRLIDAR